MLLATVAVWVSIRYQRVSPLNVPALLWKGGRENSFNPLSARLTSQPMIAMALGDYAFCFNPLSARLTSQPLCAWRARAAGLFQSAISASHLSTPPHGAERELRVLLFQSAISASHLSTPAFVNDSAAISCGGILANLGNRMKKTRVTPPLIRLSD